MRTSARVARDQHRGGVHHVLARRAPVHVAGRVALDGVGERLDERSGRVGGGAAPRGRAPRGRTAPASAGGRAIASAASPGITPASASAAASAASKSSIAAIQARSETAARTASGTNSAPKRPLDVKEGGLAVALQVDVEAQHAVLGPGDERRAPAGLDRAESTGSASLASPSSGK